MNLDTSTRYFTIEDGCFMVKLPENCTPAVLAEIATYLKPKLTEAVDAGHNKAVINVQALKSLRYRRLGIVMNGPLAGEMVTDVRFEGVSQGAVFHAPVER